MRSPLALLAVPALSAALAAACATAPANHYQRTLTAQESCCAGITDPAARKACAAEIPRAQGNESSAFNQETFACVDRHFRCDSATGRATRESAQHQLDCLNDLESTQHARTELSMTTR
jgi:hypothetical protein